MRIVIAEDSVLLLDGLTRLLEAEGHQVTGHKTADELVAAMSRADALPDLLVTDVRMPPSHTDEGLRAAVEARRLVPGTAVLVLSQYVEVAYADELLADGRGGVGYLLKDRVADVDTFLAALEDVVSGGTVLDPQREAQRLRENSALGRSPEAGDTPIIQRRQRGLLDGLL